MEQQHSIKLKTIAELMNWTVIHAADDYNTKLLHTADVHRPGLQFAGFYNYFGNNRLQLVGNMEIAYIEMFPLEERRKRFDEWLSHDVPAVIMCHGKEPLPEMLEAAKEHNITVFTSDRTTTDTMGLVIRELKQGLALRVTIHGVLVEVYGVGILILGESGVGKSEAAIELLKRGHRLIADDAVEIRHVDVTTLTGTAPDLIRYYVELRGIGVIDVRQTFGIGAIKQSQDINLVVNLEPWKEGLEYERLGISQQHTRIADVNVPSLTIPVKPGRNLAIILEVAAISQRQKSMGYDAAAEFTKQINKHFEDQMS